MTSHNFSNQQQERIYHRLNTLVSPGAAAFWRDACRLMELEPPLESTTHFVGHSLREIESSLRAVLRHIWEPSEQPSKEPSKKKDSGNDKHKAQILAVLLALEIPETSDVAQTWLSLPGKDSEYGLHKHAHRDDLAPPRKVDEKFRQFWRDIEAVFDKVLDRFETRYSDIRRKLDELLAKPEPSNKDLDTLRLHIPNSFSGLGYFFEQLKFSGWLEPLRKEGFFANIPKPEIDAELGLIRFLPWPQSRYLVRIVSQKPEIVLDIALQILETGTNNISVHEDLAQAALLMPPELAARWVKKETDWLKEQGYLDFFLAEKLGELVTYLTEKSQIDKALALLQELLAVLPSFQSTDSQIGISRQDRSLHFNDHEYGEILENHVPKLLEVAGEPTFNILCDLLGNAVDLSPGKDYSHHSRSSIEDNPLGIRELLISGVRDAAENLAKNNPLAVRTLVSSLENYNWTIFQRIALYLLRRFPDEVQDLIAARLTNRDRFHNQQELYEYRLLMREQFVNLPSESQEIILTWIEEGLTDVSWVSKNEADRASYIKYWQRDWLGILNSSLPREWQQQYEQLVEELGPAESLEPVGRTKTGAGLTSPKSAEELADMSMAELFAFLKEWQPTGELFAPSLTGLAVELSQVIAQKPEDFIEEIEQFKEVDPEYTMSGFLRGLQNALKVPSEAQPKFYCWERVLEFCSWMLEELRELPESKVPVNGFEYWRWNQICTAVVELIDAGLKVREENQIPLQFRSSIWAIIEQLTDDQRATPRFETHYRYSNGSPTDSVNTIRGKAMHTVMRYALWVKQYLQGDGNKEVKATRGFDEIPEVQKLLERHLNPQYDPSLAIRSVYGQWLPHLMNLDLDWAAQNLERIFPREEAFQELRDAAWEGYVTSNYVYSNVFTLLRGEYSHAIEQIDTPTPKRQHLSRSDEDLTKHLLNLYWYGVLELGELDRLLERFFAKAPTYNRDEFIRQIGWRLRYGNVEVDTHLLRRLQRLWEWRISEVEKTRATNSQASELKFFSWWFVSGKFDGKWAIAQLINALRFAKALHYDRELLSHLLALTPSMPLATVECLGLMAEVKGNPGNNLFAFHRQEDYRPILSAVLQSEDDKARKAAKELINRLLVRGVDFRDLLPDREV